MKHLISTVELAREEIIEILDAAEDMAEVSERASPKLPLLQGRTVANLFFENSTRTRLSFEAAAKRLSADVITFSVQGSSVAKGESLKDTAKTIAALGADALVIRHFASGAPRRLAEAGWIDAAVVNAGDGTHQHPTQALLDAFTLRAQFYPGKSRGKSLDGLAVTIVGDIAHSRVARANVWLLGALGARVHLVAPYTLLPPGVDDWPVTFGVDLDEAIANAPDALMMLRVQRERMREGFFPNEQEYARNWGLTEARFVRLPRHTVILHPGPINRGLEIAARVADSQRSMILTQVSSGVAVRMAVLALVLDALSKRSGERV